MPSERAMRAAQVGHDQGWLDYDHRCEMAEIIDREFAPLVASIEGIAKRQEEQAEEIRFRLNLSFRTDRNNNPAAFTTDVARQAGLVEGVDYVVGDKFVEGGRTLYTARLLGDPVAVTIRVIDKVGFYNRVGSQRWVYIGIPEFVWKALSPADKKRVVHFMYKHEGGQELEPHFYV